MLPDRAQLEEHPSEGLRLGRAGGASAIHLRQAIACRISWLEQQPLKAVRHLTAAAGSEPLTQGTQCLGAEKSTQPDRRVPLSPPQHDDVRPIACVQAVGHAQPATGGGDARPDRAELGGVIDVGVLPLGTAATSPTHEHGDHDGAKVSPPIVSCSSGFATDERRVLC
jgi:hypothetical protein